MTAVKPLPQQSFNARLLYSIIDIIGMPDYVFDQMGINLVFLFYMYDNDPISVFIQSSKDFFIYF